MSAKQREQPAKFGSEPNSARLLWTALFLAFGAYAALFIYKTSFVIDGVRYFSLFDDAMVAMKYGHNLAAGHGLLWNPGEPPVEGVTDPLWVLYMGLLHLLPVSVAKLSLLVQTTSAVLLFLNLLVIRRIAERVTSTGFAGAFYAAVLTAFYYPLNNWSLQGMEVGLLALIVSLAALLALAGQRTTGSLHQLYLLLGAATLVRMDAAVVCLSVCLFLAWSEPNWRRKHLLIGLGWLLAFLALQTTARWLYYGEVLPNTYYLKMVGYPALGRIKRGFSVAGEMLFRLNPILIIATAFVVWKEGRKELRLLAFMILGQFAYSVYVGGDAWEMLGGANRYICVAMPLFFVLFSHSLFTLASRLKDDRIKRRILLALVPFALVTFNWTAGRYWLREWLLLTPPTQVTENAHWVSVALQLKEITEPDATIAVIWAGSIPYFSDRNCVDMLGKSDKYIAHLPMRRLLMGFYPGHMKWNYAYSIGRLRPDVVAQIWMNRAEARPFVEAWYVPLDTGRLSVSLRRDSTRIRWQKVRELLRTNRAPRSS